MLIGVMELLNIQMRMVIYWYLIYQITSLYRISFGLLEIHENHYIHHDLHQMALVLVT